MVAVPLRSHATVQTVPQRIYLRPGQNRLLFTGSCVNLNCRDRMWLPAMKLAFDRLMQRICTARNVLCSASLCGHHLRFVLTTFRFRFRVPVRWQFPLTQVSLRSFIIPSDTWEARSCCNHTHGSMDTLSRRVVINMPV
jgi:hypothetical protein